MPGFSAQEGVVVGKSCPGGQPVLVDGTPCPAGEFAVGPVRVVVLGPHNRWRRSSAGTEGNQRRHPLRAGLCRDRIPGRLAASARPISTATPVSAPTRPPASTRRRRVVRGSAIGVPASLSAAVRRSAATSDAWS